MNVKPRKYLVVGGLGFLGSHVTQALTRTERQIAVLDRHEATENGVVGANVVIYQGDFAVPLATTPRGALSEVETVLHFAWTSLPGDAGENIAADAAANVAGSLALFGAACDEGVKTILFAGSGGTVYGPQAVTPTPEDAPTHPLCAYGVTKLAVEHYLRLYTLGRSFFAPADDRRAIPPERGIVLRYGNPFGRSRPHLHGRQGVIDVALGKLLRDEPLEIWGDGSVVRDYFHIDDLTRITLGVLDRVPKGFHIFNVGSGNGVSLRDAVALIEKVTGRQLRKTFRSARPMDVPVSILDSSKLLRQLDLKSEISLADGIARAWEQVCKEN
jgi:UDP-glucose 4-epimerase